MSEIKCIYKLPYCTHWNSEYRSYREFINDIWYCDSDDGCPGYDRPPKAEYKGYKISNPQCIYAKWKNCEFSKSVKKYSFDELDGLKIGKMLIDSDYISYLEIDGRIIINDLKQEVQNERSTEKET